MIRPEHPFDIRPDLRKAETTKAETTTAETVIRPKQLVRVYMRDASRNLLKSTVLRKPESGVVITYSC